VKHLNSRAPVGASGFAMLLCVLAACGDDATALPFDADGSAPPVEDAGTGEVAPSTDAATPPDASDGASPRAPFDPTPAEITCGDGACAKRIVAGYGHYCVVLADQSLRCWGKARALAPSVDASEPSTGPRTVAAVQAVIDVAAGGDGTCAVTTDGSVLCWDTTRSTPTPVAGIAGADRVWVASNGTMRCARVAGDLMCWRGGAVSKLETGVPGVVEAVALSSNATFVIADGGEVSSAGTDGLLLGRPASSVAGSPSPVEDLPLVLSMGVSSHACAIAVDGRLFCWGRGTGGQLGLGYSRDEIRPAEVRFPTRAWPQQIAVASYHSCVRTTDGALWCWAGTNDRGQLGYPESTGVYVPTRVTTLGTTATAAVATADKSTCAIATDGTVRCWGDNRNGELGQKALDQLRHPMPAIVDLE